MNRNGRPAVLDERLRKISKEMKCYFPAELSDNRIRFFPCYGCEVVGIGSTLLGKAAIGIPFNFSYQKVEDIDPNDITLIGNQSTNWTKAAAQRLLNSLVLSNDAKRYALLREIYSVQSPLILMKAVILPAVLVFAVAVGEICARKGFRTQKLNKLWKLYALYASVYLVAAFKYFLICDLLQVSHDQRLEVRVIQDGDLKIIGGGVEYWEKLLQRNLAFRQLLGPDGSSFFAKNGNQLYHLGSHRLPITERAQMLADFDKKPEL